MSTKPGKSMQTRIFIIMLAVILIFTGVSGGQLAHIMIVKGDYYQSKASEQQLYDNLVTAPRGDIYDRNMNLLATSAPAWTVYITPNGIKKLTAEEADEVCAAISTALSEILGMTYDEIYEKTQETRYYVIVKKKVGKSVADKIREFLASEKGEELELTQYIGLDETTKRYYPNDSLASAVLGFVGDDNQGLAGLESYYDNELTGEAGRVVAAKNAAGINMPFTYQKVEDAKAGHSLVSTLDSYIQYVCEKRLDAAVEANMVAERGAAIVMNVNTGAILGMAVSGDFNPNEPFTLSAEDQGKVDAEADEEKKSKLRSDLLNRQWRNKAVSDTYEPGSVFKIFTAAVALEENLVNKNSSFTCNYSLNVAGQTYHCWKAGGHGTQNLAEAISHSCNPAFITIGQLVGSGIFSKYFESFGLTGKSGIDLPGEALPTYHKQNDMGITELSSSSFGQTFNITPIQTMVLASAAVNGGYIVEPHIVNQVIDENKKIVSAAQNDHKRQVLSESTSSTMRELLEFVVQDGAKNALVTGYRVGGKTGTSQKLIKILQTGNSRLYIGSYVGMAPINDPQIAVFVMLDETMGSNYYGGATCAPVGSQIMSDILPYLGIEPQYTQEELERLAVLVPDVKDTPTEEAKQKIRSAGLTYRVIGNGENVTRQLPDATSSLYKNGTVILYTDADSEETAVVPSLVGLTATEANTAANNAGINIEFSGNTSSAGLKSVSQSIEAGQTVPAGTIVTVYFIDDTVVDFAE